MPERELPIVEVHEDDDISIENAEIDIKSPIANLGLNETHIAVINCHLNGMHFPQIAEVIQRALALLTIIYKLYRGVILLSMAKSKRQHIIQ